jgi:hypothetical protein
VSPVRERRSIVSGHRELWLKKLVEAGVRRRAELFYQELDGLQQLRRKVRGELLAESRNIRL